MVRDQPHLLSLAVCLCLANIGVRAPQAEPLTWQRIFCKGRCPEGRHNHTASLWSDQMIICGGENPVS
jgi:hypothetical protein